MQFGELSCVIRACFVLNMCNWVLGNICMRNCVWNSNPRGTEKKKKTKMNMKILEIELNCISGWRLAPLMKKVMNGSVHENLITLLPFDMRIWQVEDEDIEGVHEVIVDHRSFLISRPLRRPLALHSPILHRLV